MPATPREAYKYVALKLSWNQCAKLSLFVFTGVLHQHGPMLPLQYAMKLHHSCVAHPRNTVYTTAHVMYLKAVAPVHEGLVDTLGPCRPHVRNARQQVVRIHRRGLAFALWQGRNATPQVQVLRRKIDNCWVFFDKETVFRKSRD